MMTPWGCALLVASPSRVAFAVKAGLFSPLLITDFSLFRTYFPTSKISLIAENLSVAFIIFPRRIFSAECQELGANGRETCVILAMAKLFTAGGSSHNVWIKLLP